MIRDRNDGQDYEDYFWPEETKLRDPDYDMEEARIERELEEEYIASIKQQIAEAAKP